MMLCIDVGNTATKLFQFDGDNLLKKVIVATNKKMQEGEFATHLEGFKDVAKVVFSSVVPEVSSKCKNDIKAVFGDDINIIEIGPGVKTGINIAVPHPREVGSDIVAQAVAALTYVDGPVMIIGMGTATVFIMVSEDRKIKGATFIPGIELAMKSLSVATSKLTSVELNNVKEEFGIDTTSAIQTGLVFSQVGTINKMCQIAQDQYGKVNFIVSGGYYKMIKDHLNENIKEIDDLTIKGLKKIGELND